ncbi:acetyltransferase [Salinibacterium sp. dk2585]|uniref:acyltransferase family protein n=1 Tax=unclassified Salinibacterium TaxID=2632331 RepID=UPI0011C2574F|nr:MULTISPECIES: acyltransferase family protein [unclassified Salinibacterium]QEE60642.1 acetyltransferase [Salinibacterium sp. dk2585]TXK55714.1 acetyltransferase [Salinibacterium sp. dk5596]
MTATPSTTEPALRGTPAAGRFTGLDGLRAVAVLAVIVYHFMPVALPGGFLGVDIFFVISGFLITALLLRERERDGRIHLGRFWLRRARRLLPAIGLLVITCGGIAWLIGGDVLIGLGLQVLGAATFSSNWIAVAAGQSYFDDSTPELFRNLWSLAVEEQFYVVWPALLLVLLLVPARRLRIAILLALAAASALGMALTADPAGDATRAYFGTDTHSFGLALGAALAFIAQSRPAGRAAKVIQAAGVTSLGLIVAAAFVLRDDSALTYRGGLAVVAALTALVILAGIQPASRLGRALDIRPLAWIGERSYGLYLWHWPAHVLTASVVTELAPGPGAPWITAGIALLATVIAAQLSYAHLEQPVRRLGFRGAARAGWRALSGWRGAAVVPAGTATRRRGRAVAFGLAIACSIALTAGTIAGIAADPGTGSVQQQIQAGQDAIRDAATPAPLAPGDGGEGEAEPQSAPAEIPGGDQITAIGDSVMLASAASMQQVLPGIDIDAAVSRQFSSAPALIRAHLDAGTLRPVVLLGLGTNGPVDTETLAEVRELLGTSHQLVLVNVHAPRWWTDGVNSTLTSFAQQYRDVELANWRDSIAPQLRLLARDQIHPGDAGGLVYAAAVQDALQRLAELPPVVGPRDYGLAPQPT